MAFYTALQTMSAQFLSSPLGRAFSRADGRLGPAVKQFARELVEISNSTEEYIDASGRIYNTAVDKAFSSAWDFVKPHPTADSSADFANGSFPASTGTVSNGGGGNGC